MKTIPIRAIIDDRLRPTHSSFEKVKATPSQVCDNCTSGLCCIVEDPIELRADDVERLATHLDMDVEAFLTEYTSDLFDFDDDEWRAKVLAGKDRSKRGRVTMLARKTTSVGGECVFLGWRTNEAGHLSRGCTVHSARPFACREYDYSGCADLEKSTWELGCMTSAVIEAVEKGVNVHSVSHRRTADDRTTTKLYSVEGPAYSAEIVAYLAGVAQEAKDFKRGHGPGPAMPMVISPPSLPTAETRAGRKLKQCGTRAWNHSITAYHPATYNYGFAHRLSLADRVLFDTPIPIPQITLDKGTHLETRAVNALKRACVFYLQTANWLIRSWEVQRANGVTDQQIDMLDELLLSFTSGLRSSETLRRCGLLDSWKIGHRLIVRLFKDCLADPDVRLQIMREKPDMELWATLVFKMPPLRSHEQMWAQWAPQQGRRRAFLGSSKAFDAAYDQVLYARLFAAIGSPVKPYDVFEHYLLLLMNKQITRENYVDYYNLTTHIAYGMHVYGMSSMKDYARLAPMVKAVAENLWSWMKTNDCGWDDPELIGEFVDATHLLLGYAATEHTRELVNLLISTQDVSGAWLVNTPTRSMRWSDTERDVPQDQEEYLYGVEHATMVGIDALRAFLDDANGTIHYNRNSVKLP